MAKDEIEGRKVIHLDFRIYDDTYPQFCAYLTFINDCIDRGDKMPARVLKKWFSFFVGDPLEYFLENQRESLTLKVLTRFKNDSTYDFTVIREEEGWDVPFYNNSGSGIINVQHSLSEMINRGCSLMINEQFRNIDQGKIKLPLTRDELFIELYRYFKGYVSRINDVLPDYKDSRLQTIAAFTIHEMGFPFTDQKNPSNQLLFQRSRNAASKIDK
jgi:hypothetical protein